MFEAFKTVFVPDANTTEIKTGLSASEYSDDQLEELLTRFGGQSFNGGIYRVVPPNAIGHWNDLALGAFPSYSGRLSCFAMDWMGRIFALDSARLEEGQQGVVMLEPGTAEALEIPCNIVSFHENELIQFQEEALAVSFYRKWLAHGGSSPGMSQCAGYRKPLFLGGSDSVENLVVSDSDVYWTIMGQLIQKTRGLPPGKQIGEITIDYD